VSDTEPLSRLTSLTSLDLNSTPVSDTEPLSRLTNLTSLDLRYTPVSDTEPLGRLTNLTSLHLSYTRVSDTEPLSRLTSLTSLDLNSTPVSDTEPLSRLTNLTSLDLSSTQVSDTEPFSRLTNLTSLDLSSTKVSDTEPLSRLTNLTSLDLDGTPVSNIEPLSRLMNLASLYLSNCQLSQLPVSLLALPNLRTLWLYGNPIEPKEVLGDDRFSNCLEAVRAHVADCERGAQSDRELKLILIGNGRVGKSSLIKRLIHNAFDPDESSTHGIRLERWDVELVGEPARVNVWDFGGQDIYHGTHALFLKSRAVFLIVWDRDTELNPAGCYSEGDLRFEHLPLAYWLEYVRTASPGSPVIVVQTKCDDGQGHPPPADVASLPNVTFSAKTAQGRDILLAHLKQMFANELSHHAAHTIGIGRWNVKQTIRGYQDADEARPPAERTHRTITHAHFVELCQREGDKVSSPTELLRYLHNTGVVYYQPELFEGAIILDQRWAIEAIYCIYDRRRTYPVLRRKHGRFKLSDLNDLSWAEAGFSASEQKLFVSFMQSCSICFQISGHREKDPEFIAPELLPDRDTVEDEIALRRATADDDQSVQLRGQYRFLHQGVTRRLTARIGRLFRTDGVYWQDGLIFRSAEHRGVAQIEWRRKLAGDPARGEHLVQVWGSGRRELLNVLRTELRRLHEGELHVREFASVDGQQWIDLEKLPDANRIGQIVAQSGQVIDVAPFRFLLQRDEATLDWQPARRRGEPAAAEMTVPPPPATAQKPVYISYAWGDDTPDGKLRGELVERLYESLKADRYDVRRDKADMRYKDSISQFMEELGSAPCVVAVISDKYLRSRYCMYELYRVWTNLQFRERLCPIVLPDAKLDGFAGRVEWVRFWQDQEAEADAALAKLRREHTAPLGLLTDYDHIRRVAQHADEILSFVSDMNTLTPELLKESDFASLKRAIGARLGSS
jgi:internalin A